MGKPYWVQNNKIVVCGIVRDAEKGLIRNIPVVSQFLSMFGDYRVFIYENDSKDKTKEILERWHLSDPSRIHKSLNCQDTPPCIPTMSASVTANPFFSRRRIGKMTALRNKYLEYIEEQSWEANYLMVIDLDVARLDLQGILSSFEPARDWDAVTAFGYSTSPKLRRRYHDSYALVLLGEENAPQTERSIRANAELLGGVRADADWIPVASGFGGLAIYKWEAIKGLRYHVIDNNDPRVEVRCEHFSICQQMIERGYDKIYINPAMQLKYQDLTFRIIWNSMKRMIKGSA